MKAISHVDIFTLPNGSTEAMTVTTNGMIKNNGHAVMGRGIAKSVEDRYQVSGKLASHLRQNGNVPCDLGIYDGFHVLSFPTKNDWRDDSDLNLIVDSARGLMQLADELGLERVYITKPGCGAGRLDWDNVVKPAIKQVLDDRFVVVLDNNDTLDNDMKLPRREHNSTRESVNISVDDIYREHVLTI